MRRLIVGFLSEEKLCCARMVSSSQIGENASCPTEIFLHSLFVIVIVSIERDLTGTAMKSLFAVAIQDANEQMYRFASKYLPGVKAWVWIQTAAVVLTQSCNMPILAAHRSCETQCLNSI